MDFIDDQSTKGIKFNRTGIGHPLAQDSALIHGRGGRHPFTDDRASRKRFGIRCRVTREIQRGEQRVGIGFVGRMIQQEHITAFPLLQIDGECAVVTHVTAERYEFTGSGHIDIAPGQIIEDGIPHPDARTKIHTEGRTGVLGGIDIFNKGAVRHMCVHGGGGGAILHHQRGAAVAGGVRLNIPGKRRVDDLNFFVGINGNTRTAFAGIDIQAVAGNEAPIQGELAPIDIDGTAIYGSDGINHRAISEGQESVTFDEYRTAERRGAVRKRDAFDGHSRTYAEQLAVAHGVAIVIPAEGQQIGARTFDRHVAGYGIC